MDATGSEGWLAALRLERGPDAPPLHRQIYAALRASVLDGGGGGGGLEPGARLPSSRRLAGLLGVSRGTVLEALEQLVADGFLEARPGSGTFVADAAGARPPVASRSASGEEAGVGARPPGTGPGLSARGRRRLAAAAPERSHDRPVPFQPGLPETDATLLATWRRLHARELRALADGDGAGAELGYGDPAGEPSLREAVAASLRAARGMRCAPGQVIATSGTQGALALTLELLTDPGDVAWVEDPGYPSARAAVEAAGLALAPVPVDAEGLRVERGEALAPAARLAYVTPSHHYPTGATLSLRRRLELLAWAERADAWIFEDDYDREFRARGRPLAPLAGLGTAARRVVYAGTFSKLLFPGLRLGYAVVPEGLAAAFRAARAQADRGPGRIEQRVLARFLAEGHAGRHARRMRRAYAARRAALERALAERLGERVRALPSDGGLQLCVLLPDGADDAAVAAAMAASGFGPRPLSAYAADGAGPPGLVIGFAHGNEGTLRAGVEALARILGPRR